MAPFTPFLTEHIYQNLRKAVRKNEEASQEENEESIHYLMLPKEQ
jgi:isoleucyl-tRNA synthetase